MKDALRQVKDGVILDLEITPNAKETGIQGYNQWRKRIEVRLSEQAQKGKANDQLISFFSDLFHINHGKVRILTGLTGSKKSVKIVGATAEYILEILNSK